MSRIHSAVDDRQVPCHLPILDDVDKVAGRRSRVDMPACYLSFTAGTLVTRQRIALRGVRCDDLRSSPCRDGQMSGGYGRFGLGPHPDIPGMACSL